MHAITKRNIPRPSILSYHDKQIHPSTLSIVILKIFHLYKISQLFLILLYTKNHTYNYWLFIVFKNSHIFYCKNIHTTTNTKTIKTFNPISLPLTRKFTPNFPNPCCHLPRNKWQGIFASSPAIPGQANPARITRYDGICGAPNLIRQCHRNGCLALQKRWGSWAFARRLSAFQRGLDSCCCCVLLEVLWSVGWSQNRSYNGFYGNW